MQSLSPFRRWIVIPALVIGLVFGLLASNGLIGGTAFRKSEPNQRTNSVQSQNSLDSLPVYFEEDRGRTNDKTRYLARGNGGATLFLTAAEAVYVLRSPTSSDLPTSSTDQKPKTEDRALAVHMKLSGANEAAVCAGEEQLEHRTNYLVGSDSSRWQTGIPNYRRVLVNDIYDGVDMVWQGKTRGEVQYDFIVKPNANPAKIEWRIEGARNVSIDADGSLLIDTELGAIRQGKPFSYQDSDGLRAEVESRYVVSGNLTSNTANRNSFEVKFELGDYDRSKNLTIDPSVNLSNLAFSTLLGGNAEDQGNSIAVDSAGNVYVTGKTRSLDFPTTAGGVDTSQNADRDAFVTKLSAGGTLIYSTFIGGNAFDEGNDISVDASGNAYLIGMTASPDFPTKGNTPFGGVSDVFVTKLNANGSALLHSRLIGGNSVDIGQSLTIDESGNVYLTGGTGSANFPVQQGAFDVAHNGSTDVFVMKVNLTTGVLFYSTFIGGSVAERANGIAVDRDGNAYLTGFTSSANYPTESASDSTFNSLNDVFVTKLNARGSALIYSTFIGGTSSEAGAGIAIDLAGNSYVTGVTASPGYPTTIGSFNRTFEGDAVVFVTKLDASGSLTYSTFIGGTSTGNDVAGIAVDASGSAHVVGDTGNPNYPTTLGAFDTTHNGSKDVFVTKLNARGSALIYSTFIGGGNAEQAKAIAMDSPGNIYLTGTTSDFTPGVANYPTTSDTIQPAFNSGQEVFVTKLGDFAISGRVVDEVGAPLPNVAVAMSGARSGFMRTDGQGYFGFIDTVPRGNFTVAATNSNFVFTPNSFQVDSITRNQEFVFIGRR